MAMRMYVRLSVRMPAHPFICMSVRMSVRMSMHMSKHRSTDMSVHLSTYMSIRRSYMMDAWHISYGILVMAH